jgi:hypothetical protein
MSAAAKLLERLDRVRQTGTGRWIARCPSHEDRSPSLSIREVDDGRVLIHDFAGCETGDILAAVGLTLTDLYPARLADSLTRVPQAFSAIDALRALTFESSIVAICASDIAEGRSLSAIDADRIALAAGRIATALEFVHG